ncbi:MAG: MFS transporter [Hyphomicrobiales bacterium]
MTSEYAAKRPIALIIWVCVAHIFTMTGFSVYPALLPQFSELWSLSSGQAGTISAALFAGYTASVPLLVTLTDRIDPRKVYVFSATLSVVGLVGFALYAHDTWSASVFHALFGAGLGGTYMPGLKALSDHIDARILSRATGFYTGCFSIGAALSYLYADVVFSVSGWQMAYLLAAGFTCAGAIIVFIVVPGTHPDSKPTPFSAMIKVFSNKSALTWSICYGFHSWELFAFRAWTVAFLAFLGTQAVSAGDTPFLYDILPPVTIAALATLTGMPASLLGNELCIRYGRRMMVIAVMLGASAAALLTGGAAYMAYWVAAIAVLIYSIAIMGDSASLTAAAVANAQPGLRGATMAVHSTIGFAGAAMGPVVFGYMLDVGGHDNPQGWFYAFSLMALLSVASIVLIKFMKPQSAVGDRDLS